MIQIYHIIIQSLYLGYYFCLIIHRCKSHLSKKRFDFCF